MVVSQAMRQQLLQKYQQKQQTETLAAQASTAATHSADQPHSSGSKEPAVVQTVNRPAAVEVHQPQPAPAVEPQRQPEKNGEPAHKPLR